MGKARQLIELHSEEYRGRTITVYQETFTVNGRHGPETVIKFGAWVKPEMPGADLPECTARNRFEALSAAKSLIEREIP